jgi:tRNA nucleotidyltransferase/poly(A) polymerase
LPIDLIKLIPEPYLTHLRTIDQKVKDAGYECFLVGGAVRDLVMGIVPHEYDFTTNAKPNDVKKLFHHVVETGIKHGTLTIVLEKTNYEITTYRIDKDYIDGRRPESVEFGNSLSEDLKRRDFTMNALALDLSTGEIIDEHLGLSDIKNGVIQTIGNPIQRFSEDGLRPIRALRFASNLGFTIQAETKNAISKTKTITQKISVERFQDEILKSFRGKKPSLMLSFLVEESIFPLFLKETAFETTIQRDNLYLLDEISKEFVGLQVAVAFFILCSQVSAKTLEMWLRSLKFSGQITKDCLLFTSLIQRWRNTPVSVDEDRDFTYKKYFLSPLKKHFGGNSAYTLLNSNFWKDISLIFESHSDRFISVWDERPPLLLTDLTISGNDLAKEFPNFPKQEYGKLLNQLLDLVLRSPEKNEIQALLEHSAQLIHNL